MNEKRTGTSLCGWCLGPPGAKRPHRFGISVVNCACGCHRKPRKVETIELREDWEDDGDAA